MRWPRRAGGLLVIVAVLTGPPTLIAWWWRQASPQWPTAGQLQQWVAEPLTEQTLRAAVAVTFVLLWLLTVAAMALLSVRQLRHAWATVRRMPLPTPAQATATSVAGIAVLGIPATGLHAPGAGHDPAATPPPTAPHHPSPAYPADRQHAAPAGVDLPQGGWLPAETAHAVTAAAAWGWLRRRRDYRPGFTATDNDLHPLPDTVASVQTLLPSLADTPGGGRAERDGVASRDAEAVRIEQLPPGGVGLVGPGSLDAARGILITALLAGGTQQHRHQPHIVTTRAALDTLLSPDAPGPDIMGVDITDDIPAALARFDTTSRSQSPAVSGDDNPAVIAPAILLSHPPDAATAATVTAALTVAGGTAVWLGAWPHGTTQHINTDGTAISTGANDNGMLRRWCVLSKRAASDLLAVARHAYGPLAPEPTSRPHSTVPPPKLRSADADDSPGLYLRLFGPPELTYRTSPVPLRRSAALQLLAFLAVHPEGTDARRLGAALWPGDRPHATTNRLYTTVSELRQTLQSTAGHPVINREQDRYFLDPRYLRTDVWEATAAIVDAGTATNPRNRDTSLRRVIDSYQGDLAAGRPWPWLEAPREQARRHVLTAYTVLAEHSPTDQALELLSRAMQIDPLNEDLVHRAVLLHTAGGNTSALTNLVAAFQHRLSAAGLPPAEALTRWTHTGPRQ